MVNLKDLYWLAGLWEGEGSFIKLPTGNLSMQLNMCDEDVVIKASKLLQCSKVLRRSPGAPRKDHFQIQLTGGRAVGWALTLYTLMGIRRKAKIIECVYSWRNIKRHNEHVRSQAKAVNLEKLLEKLGTK